MCAHTFTLCENRILRRCEERKTRRTGTAAMRNGMLPLKLSRPQVLELMADAEALKPIETFCAFPTTNIFRLLSSPSRGIFDKFSREIQSLIPPPQLHTEKPSCQSSESAATPLQSKSPFHCLCVTLTEASSGHLHHGAGSEPLTLKHASFEPLNLFSSLLLNVASLFHAHQIQSPFSLRRALRIQRHMAVTSAETTYFPMPRKIGCRWTCRRKKSFATMVPRSTSRSTRSGLRQPKNIFECSMTHTTSRASVPQLSMLISIHTALIRLSFSKDDEFSFDAFRRSIQV
eukprot:4465430-Pleurochrysis_carterae.AAC.1